MVSPRIAIIGAGIAGLACARRLAGSGIHAELFDKSHRPGGRMASRPLALIGASALVDHGAQYFTARSTAFQSLCDEALAAGAIAPWTGLVRDERSGVEAAAISEARLVGQPDMNALPRWLARGLTLHCDSEVSQLAHDSQGWSLAFAARPPLSGFDAVVLALPAEQAAVLLSPVAPALAAEARAARSAPCWAGLFGFQPDAHWPDWQALRPAEGHALGWLARSRDGRGLIVHAAPAWSRSHLEDDPATVQAALLAAVHELVPGLGVPEVFGLHRWRFALVEAASGSPFGFNAKLALGVCGDWRLGPRVELAWTSGDALGAALPGLLEGR